MTYSRFAWIRTAILVGLVYYMIGRLFAVPGEHALAWRWAAWVVSLLVYTAHFRYERVRQGSAPRTLALYIATAVAIGAFGIALAGMMRSFAVLGSIRATWVLALVLFPAATAGPAFLVALVAAVALARRGQPTEFGAEE